MTVGANRLFAPPLLANFDLNGAPALAVKKRTVHFFTASAYLPDYSTLPYPARTPGVKIFTPPAPRHIP